MTRLILILFCSLFLGLIPYSLQAQFIRDYNQGLAGEAFRDAQQTIDGGYIAIGDGYDLFPVQANTYRKMFLVKTDAVGDVQWTQQFDQAPLDSLDYMSRRVLQTSDGGYLIMANQTTNVWGSPVTTNVVLVKTNPAGNITWSKTHRLTYKTNLASDIIPTNDGGFVFCGEKTNAIEYFIYKIDLQGDSV